MLGSSMLASKLVNCQTKIDSSFLTNVTFSSKSLYPSILPLQMTRRNPTSQVLTKQKDPTTPATTSEDVQVIAKEKDEKKIVNRTFAEFILKNLTNQRSLDATTHSTCDVIIRCGSLASFPVHSCVLVAVSRFFRRLLSGQAVKRAGQHNLAVGIAGGALDVDVGDLFRSGELEKYFSNIIEALYEGKRFVSQNAILNKALGNVYAAFELEPDAKFEAVELPTEYNNIPKEIPSHHTQSSSTLHPIHQESSDLNQQQINDRLTSDKLSEDQTKVGDDEEEEDAMEVGMVVSSCAKCNLYFMSQSELVDHKKLRTCSRKFTCHACGKVYTSVKLLVSHLVETKHGGTVCSVCNFAVEALEDMETHIQRHALDLSKPYFCHGCESRFSTRKRWDQHLPKHLTEAPHVCPICNKGFKWKHACTAHMVVHSTEKKYLCQECGFSTSHASTFKFHQRNHNGQLMKCQVVLGCKFQTTRKSNLLQHQLTHSKDKPHQCEVCGRSFSLAKNMRRHARQHDTNATIYACKVVGCSFNSLRSDKYLEHMKRYHPTSSNDSSSTTSFVSTKTPVSLATTEAFLVKPSSQNITQLTPSIITQCPVAHHHHPQEGVPIVSMDTTMPTTTHDDPIPDDENSLLHLQDERNNQSSPIPTKNVDTGRGGRKRSPIVLTRTSLNTSPVIGIISMTSPHIVVKEDSSCSENGILSEIASTSSSSNVIQLSVNNTSVSNVSRVGGRQENNEIQAFKLKTNIEASCPTTYSQMSTHVVTTTTTMEERSSRLAKNVFNTISPPNKTVTDALSTFSDTPPVPLEEPSVFSSNPEESMFTTGGVVTELDDVVDSVISNSSSSMQF